MTPDTTDDGWHDQVAGECIRELMTDRPTPETDAAARRATVGDATRYVVSREFAERLERQRDELAAWKWEQMAVEDSWDAQSVASILSVPLGVPIRPSIEPGIRALVNQRDELTELVAKWRDMTPEEMRLRAGDMTAQEVRSVKAVLNAILPNSPDLPPTTGSGDSSTP